MSNRNPEEREKQTQWNKSGEDTMKDPNRDQKQQQPKPPFGQQPGQKPPQRQPGQPPTQEEKDPNKKRTA